MVDEMTYKTYKALRAKQPLTPVRYLYDRIKRTAIAPTLMALAQFDMCGYECSVHGVKFDIYVEDLTSTWKELEDSGAILKAPTDGHEWREHPRALRMAFADVSITGGRIYSKCAFDHDIRNYSKLGFPRGVAYELAVEDAREDLRAYAASYRGELDEEAEVVVQCDGCVESFCTTADAWAADECRVEVFYAAIECYKQLKGQE